MLIKRIEIKNVASFVDFCPADSFKHTNLLFGTNGSGKSSLMTFLQLMDRYNNGNDPSDREAVKSFFAERFSKEASTDLAKVEITFESSNYIVTLLVSTEKGLKHTIQKGNQSAHSAFGHGRRETK